MNQTSGFDAAENEPCEDRSLSVYQSPRFNIEGPKLISRMDWVSIQRDVRNNPRKRPFIRLPEYLDDLSVRSPFVVSRSTQPNTQRRELSQQVVGWREVVIIHLAALAVLSGQLVRNRPLSPKERFLRVDLGRINENAPISAVCLWRLDDICPFNDSHNKKT